MSDQESQMVIYSQKLEEAIKKEFEETATPEFLSLIRGGLAAHEHAFQKYKITKEKYLEWISLAWNRGVHQREVYDMKTEGCVDNWLGIAMNLGGYLWLHGLKEGYLTQKKDK